MNRRHIWPVWILGTCLACTPHHLWAQNTNPLEPGATLGTVSLDDGTLIGFGIQGGQLPASNYDWWYGCSPTSAGMLMGYYDRGGYSNRCYRDLVPGGVAEENSFGGGSSLLCNNTIASPGHIADFYTAPYGASGDDVAAPWHAFDCLADFMGSSQDSQGNTNGSTTFWFRTDGQKTYPSNIEGWGKVGSDGMYGIKQYVQQCGYAPNGSTGIYTQLTNNDYLGYGFSGGFTFANFKAEIDAGRPVLIHVVDHTMLGYGYTGTDTIYVYDTWNPNGQNPGTMTWGGSYSGMTMWGVTALQLSTTGAPTLIDGGTGQVMYDADGFLTGAAGGDTAGLRSGHNLATTMEVSNFDAGPDGLATLKFFYSDEELTSAGIADESVLGMYWWDDSAWRLGGSGTYYAGAPQGGLGDYGLDAAGNYAWVNVNHGSLWALASLVPEPSTFALSVLGLLGLVAASGRRRR